MTDAGFGDIVLAAALAEMMRRSRLHPGAVINVTDGVVTLEGEVDTVLQREETESLVTHFQGVVRVINMLKIKPIGA